jgi:hypothetical protein
MKSGVRLENVCQSKLMQETSGRLILIHEWFGIILDAALLQYRDILTNVHMSL